MGRGWASCPAAFAALAVNLVFSSEDDKKLFMEAQACMGGVPESEWSAVVAATPVGGWTSSAGSGNQVISAYKKWYGIWHMADVQGDLDYGMMIDSEIVFHAFHAKDGGA